MCLEKHSSDVYLFWFPFPRETGDAFNSKDTLLRLTETFRQFDKAAVICFLTTPPDAALLLAHLEKHLRFQLWIAVKTTPDSYPHRNGRLPKRHAALLIFTKYDGGLRHTKTRIQYTYCPVCEKTTKDYGGKKHTYHQYGTLLSDVWRDIECDPKNNIDAVLDRVRDLFGLEPYKRLQLLDMRECEELIPATESSEKNISENAINIDTANIASQLINNDCLEAIKSIPDNSIDFCFADPPYNLKKKYDKWDDALESVEYFAWCDKWLTELHRVLKPGRTLAALNIPLWAARHFQYLSSLMNFQSWIAWDGLSFPVRMIMPAHYAIICFSKGTPRNLPGLDGAQEVQEEYLKPLKEFYCLRANCVSKRRRVNHGDRTAISDLWYDIHRLKHNSRRVNHPCQLPPELMRRLFAVFTESGETILDCFNGAGTSTLVAQEMKRSYIGIELSTQYHELASQRHEQVKLGMNPFAKLSTIPTAKNSRVQRLQKQKYQVSKKALQLEVKRIANEIGHLPSKDDVKQLSKFPIEYFEQYFVSWGEACAAARTTGMSETRETSENEHSDNQLTFIMEMYRSKF
ncbi:MAG TPA: DNA methyltransferase [Pyrinomonadaceae bacterium]